ncbi:MAG: hypothetical protein ACI4IG_06635 [Eubacterium sp.]
MKKIISFILALAMMIIAPISAFAGVAKTGYLSITAAVDGSYSHKVYTYQLSCSALAYKIIDGIEFNSNGIATVEINSGASKTIANLPVGSQIDVVQATVNTDCKVTCAVNDGPTQTVKTKGNDSTETSPISGIITVDTMYAFFTTSYSDIPNTEKSYPCNLGTKNQLESIDIKSLLPSDISNPSYSLADNSASYITDKSVSSSGVLSYKVNGSGINGKSTTLKVIVSSDNYTDITASVVISLSEAVDDNRDTEITYDVLPTYTVTIPATVDLGSTAMIKAENVVLDNEKQLCIKLTATSEADNSFKLKTDEDATLAYTVNNGTNDISVGDTVLAVNPDDTDTGTANLSFVKQGSEAYAGTYKGTVTFTVSIEEVISP